MGIFEKKKKTPDPEAYKNGRVYDYSTPESRVATASWLFEQAKNERTGVENQWIRHNDYYNFLHDVAKETEQAMTAAGAEWTPAMVPDPYIMVESQIVPDIPQHQFKGRDNYNDPQKAKERELAVKYIVEANRLGDMNTSNERRLRKLGDAFWKAYWDETMPFADKTGNIRVRDVSPLDIYPDPTAGPEGLQAGEYVAYVYTMHKLKFWRLYHEKLTKLGMSLEDVTGNQFRQEDDLLAPYTRGTQFRDDMVQVLEFWFRQVSDSKDAKAGDVACTVQAAGVELQYIPNYWQKTGRQCNLFPFVHYWCIRDETQFWNKSELEPILSMVDAADRELTMGLLNDAMMANDIILEEENAVVAGCEVTNVPGSVIKVKQGRMNGIARLGGLHTGFNSANMVSWLQNQMQRTNRNYDTNNGQETARVTTASGLMQLRQDAETQQQLKRADRDAGFCRLYELLDYLALEFFDDNRLLVIGAEEEGKDPTLLQFNSDNYAVKQPAVTDVLTGEVVQEEKSYYPRVDVTVTVGNGIGKNPVATLEILDKLAAVPVTEENWKLLSAQLDVLDIPQKKEIVEEWKRRFEPVVPQEVMQALEQDPELLQALTEAVAMKDAQTAPAAGVQAVPGDMVQQMPMQDMMQPVQEQMAMPEQGMSLPAEAMMM